MSATKNRQESIQRAVADILAWKTVKRSVPQQRSLPFPPAGLTQEQNQVKECLEAQGYEEVRFLAPTRWACLMPLIYTWAIIEGDMESYKACYNDRWCYHSYEQAKRALEAWDGAGEPSDWHRHPDTGRRVADDGREYVMV